MRNKVLIAVLVTLFGCLSLAKNTDVKRNSLVRNSTAKTILIKSQLGWQISLPQGWIAEAVAGNDVYNHPIVSISNDPALSLRKISYGGEIYIDEARRNTPATQRQAADRESLAQSGKVYPVDVRFKSGLFRGNITLQNSYRSKPPKNDAAQWTLYGTCESVDVKLTLVASLTDDELKKPLGEHKVPQLLKDVFDSFDCK